LKEEALDRTMWRNRFGRGFGPVVWQITDDDDDDDDEKNTPSFVTYLIGALYVHPLWFYKHQHDNRVRSKLSVVKTPTNISNNPVLSGRRYTNNEALVHYVRKVQMTANTPPQSAETFNTCPPCGKKKFP